MTAWLSLPDAAQCPDCGFFDIGDPAVQAIFAEVRYAEWQQVEAACKCRVSWAVRRLQGVVDKGVPP